MPRVTFVTPCGVRRTLDVPAGRTLLRIAWDNGIDIEGACEGMMACSTCHVIVADADFDRLEPPGDEEEEMLDLAWVVTPTSRLGCQIVVTDALDGLTLTLPPETSNLLET